MKPPLNATTKKYQWILWSMVALLTLIGVLCLYSSFSVPEDALDGAAQLKGLALWSICFALAVFGIERATTSFVRKNSATSNNDH